MVKEMIGGCCVCSDERGWEENPLVYCDGHGCNVAVHKGACSWRCLLFVCCSLKICFRSFYFFDHQLAMESFMYLKDRGFVENASLRRESLE